MTINPVRETFYDQLAVKVYPDNETMGQAAAEAAAAIIRLAIAERGVANIILATGNSQLTFLHALRELPDILWPAVNVFHMDEYLNLPPGHPAGFSLFLRRHLLDHVPVGAFFPVPGHVADVEAACRGYELLLRAHPADLCCLGIGENGHIAFNEPAVADFDDPVWVKVIKLDEVSRRQQVGEGHFATLDETPTQALTLTVPALRAAKRMLCIVPERRKAAAVRKTLLGPISATCPASILRRTPQAGLFLDRESAAEVFSRSGGDR
ncbi:MAG: glucosamine-6-phosphate deaminase [Chloroflexi bacterium HGW-Chloroflexi-1]|nr:MAG: glucosamine-6-phosphate deaminase [Chloroflexi bacterium HGW-Chloroflexi-1]